MGRFNWILQAFWTLSVLVCILGAPGRVDAFTTLDDRRTFVNIGPDGSENRCRIQERVDTPTRTAYLELFVLVAQPLPVTRFSYPGGVIISRDATIIGAGPSIEKATLAHCLGIAEAEIIHLEQTDTDVSFDATNYIGFTFTLSVALLGKEIGQLHEYRIGSGASPLPDPPAVITGPTVEQTQEQIAGYMQNRASQTIVAQPDLIGFLSGASTGSFNADVTQSNGNFDFATSGDQPVWATLQGSWSEFGTAESSYFFGAVGAHTNLSPDALVGLMFQFDRLTQTDGATSVEGDGYLVGPYFVAKLPNQPLFIEGRLLTGQTENEVSVVGVGSTATETFDTQRTLASIKVAGQLNYGELVLTPSLTATHLRDEQDAFTNTQGNTVAAQGIEVNSVAAGLNFAQPVSLSNGELMLTGGISGIWSSSEGTEFASSVAPSTDGIRARITLGASHTLPNGVVLSAGTFYDGIGLNDYESYGLDLGVQMQF
jgi:hypothetical protein